MGIPSYYKRLIDRFPRLVEKGPTFRLKGDVLLMDFNCLIYQCVRGPTMPAYTEESREEWEAALLEAVKAYTVRVWDVAGRPSRVLIAVDGVVPMAKIRQQRLRRFKSLWWAAKEREAGVRELETWDTNAITPGTEFMEKLGRALKGLATARSADGRGAWEVSGADEAGEGEQKVMAWIRREAAAGSLAGKEVVVYGLDADLIVLSLLTMSRAAPNVRGWKLLRELAEFEGGRAEGGAFGALNVRELLGILVPPALTPAEYMLEYACAMSFLGNDFLPHSLSVKMREGGHDLMCHSLTAVHEAGLRLVDAEGRVQPLGCAALIRGWAQEEETWMAENFSDKYKGRGPPPRNDREKAMAAVQNLPLEWAEESAIYQRGSHGLVEGWDTIYRGKWLRGAAAGQTCGEYMRGLQWIMDYYLGQPVSYTWYFPWNVPPLWRDIVKALEEVGAVAAPPVTSPVAPAEQLAMVLPEGSWRLVRDARLRRLPALAPHFWPSTFGFFSVGKRFMWECEAEVPILTIGRVKQLLA